MRHTLILLAIVACSIEIASAQTISATAQDANTSAAETIPDPHVPAYSEPTKTELQEVQDLKDLHFDFDRSDLRPDQQQTLQSDADWLKAHPNVLVTIEGDADDRGDIVYNVALSDRRASITREALVQMGVPPDRIAFATGWGKLYPVCTQSDEACWSQNRRAHFSWWTELPRSATLTKPVAAR